MANPQAISEIYATDVISNFDLHEPDKLTRLMKRYGGQGLGFLLTLKALGFELQAKNDTYSHFEERRIHDTIKAKANVSAPGGTNDILITLHSDSVDSDNNYYPRVYDEVMFSDETVGYIYDIDTSTPTAPVLTIRLNDVSQTFPAVTAGEEISIISSQFSEGSGQPTGAVSGTDEFENYAQIIKETIGVTGTEMVTQSWLTNKKDGVTSYYWLKGQADLDYRMSLKIDGALLFGRKTDNPNAIDPTTGKAIKTTHGLIPTIRDRGYVDPIAAGGEAITDFDRWDRYLDQQGVGKFSLIYAGINRHQGMENVLKPYFADTNINYTRQVVNDEIFASNESLAATVNFKLFTKSERTFLMKRMNNFNNPKTFGVTGYDMPYQALILPIDKRKDAKTKEMLPTIGFRFRGLGKYNRRMEVWQYGTAGEGLKLGDVDDKKTYQRAHVGGHWMCVNQMILVDKA